MASGAGRHVVRIVVAGVLAAGLLVPGERAWASASGCVLSESQPRSCVQVRGAGTFVEWAKGGVGLFSKSSAHGHFQVYGADLDVSTPDEVYSNDSFKANTKWGPEVAVNRDLPNGSKVCAIFWERKAPGDYKRHSPACVSIKR